MAKKKKKKAARTPSAPSAAAAGESVADQIRRGIAGGRHKTALDLAKDHHGKVRSPESEGLLIEAYLARIEGLYAKNMHAEARSLAGLVRERYPQVAPSIDALLRKGAVEFGDMDALLEPLANPGLSPEARAAAEAAVRRGVRDPAQVARSRALPEGHPLRRQAEVLSKAFEAVCSRPVEESDLGLEEVPRRSPLAPWKALILAIARFYADDREGCRRYLSLVNADSGPAPAVPVLEAALAEEPLAPKASPAAKALYQALTSRRDPLYNAALAFDKATAAFSPYALLRASLKLLSECERMRPDLLGKVKQHVYVTLYQYGAPWEHLREAMADPPRRDSYFWRLMAQVEEVFPRVQFGHCLYWELFRLHARHEGLLEPDSPTEAALYLRIASLRRGTTGSAWQDLPLEKSAAELPALVDFFYKDQPSDIREAVSAEKRGANPEYFLRLDEIYLRAAAIDPTPNTFRQWLKAELGEGGEPRAQADRVAEEWRRARPHESEPLLYLADSAERRNALTKALSYIQEAERIDALDPDVRRARLRLLCAIARRHIRGSQPHLLVKDIASLSEMEELSEGDRRALMPCLGWARHALAREGRRAAEAEAEAVEYLESPLSAHLVIHALAQLGGLPIPLAPHPPEGPEALVEAVARGCALAHEMGLVVSFAGAWRDRLAAVLETPQVPGTPWQMQVIADAALAARDDRLAYVAAGAGLALDALKPARYLAIRAQALHHGRNDRVALCAGAAASLARRSGEHELVETAIEALRASDYIRNLPPHRYDAAMAKFANLPREAEDVVVRMERELRTISTMFQTPPAYEEAFKDISTAEAQKRSAASEPSQWETGFDDSEGRYSDEDEYDDEGEFDYDDTPPIPLPFPTQMDMFDDPRAVIVEAYLEVMQETGGRLPEMCEIEAEFPDSYAKLTAALVHVVLMMSTKEAMKYHEEAAAEAKRRYKQMQKRS